MDFMNQCLENSDLLAKATSGISVEEKHLIYLELMIMEQVEDWEVGVGKTEQESGINFSCLFLGQAFYSRSLSMKQ